MFPASSVTLSTTATAINARTSMLLMPSGDVAALRTRPRALLANRLPRVARWVSEAAWGFSLSEDAIDSLLFGERYERETTGQVYPNRPLDCGSCFMGTCCARWSFCPAAPRAWDGILTAWLSSRPVHGNGEGVVPLTRRRLIRPGGRHDLDILLQVYLRG